MKRVIKQKGGLSRPFVLQFVLLFFLYFVPFVQASNLFELPGKLYPALCICFPTDEEGWIGGHFGKIWHTKDGGRTWILQASYTTENIADIYFVDTKNGWAVGYAGLIIHTSDGGKTWVHQNSPLKYFWKAVYFKDKKHGWIAGEMGTVLGTEDGGKTWKILITGDDVIFNSITFSPDGHGWVAGEFGVIYASHDSKKWFLQDNGIASQNYTVWSISYIGQDRVLASGIASLLLFKRDYKSRWQAIKKLREYNREKSLFRILKFQDKIISIGQKSIYFSKNPFGPWKEADIKRKLPYGEWLYDAWSNGKRVWVLGVKGSIYYSDNGIEWNPAK